MPVLIRDYESRSPVDLREAGSHRYAADPRTEILCAAFCVDDGPVKLWLPGQPVPAEFRQAAHDPAWVVAAFNDGFETALETYIMTPRHGWPSISIERHRCIQAQALAHALPGSLESCATALGLAHLKDRQGAIVMRQLTSPRKPRVRQGENPAGIYWRFDDASRMAKLYRYCEQDVRVERDLAQRLRPLSLREQKLWELDAQINTRGILIDRKLAEAAQRIIEGALAEIDAELEELTAGMVARTSQVARIIAWVKDQGVHTINSLSKDALAPVLADELPAPVRRALELRLEAAQAATKKIKALLDWAGADDRVRGALRFHGGATGRWSGSGPQPQNLKKLPEGLDVAKAIKAIATGSYAAVRKLDPKPLALIGSCVRPICTAAPRHRFLGGDFSGIEARVTAWLAGEVWKLAAFCIEDRGGPEVYSITAGRIYGRDPKTIVKGSPEREVGKRCELAFGFAGGIGAWRKFEKYGTGEVQFSDAQIEKFKNDWRALHPRIVEFWRRLNAAAIAATWTPAKAVTVGPIAFKRDGCFLRCKLPSSRKIAYPFPKLIPTGRLGDHALSFKDSADGQWRDVRNGEGVYGGFLCENVVQAVARDLLAEALIRLERAGYPIVLHTHDEALAEVPKHRGSVDEFRKIMTTVPTWAAGLPIAAEAYEAARYVKA